MAAMEQAANPINRKTAPKMMSASWPRRWGLCPGVRALRCRLLWGWLLLRHAVQCAEPPDQISAVDADDLAVGEEVSEDVEGEAVVGIVEDGNENEAIGNVEIGVAGGEAASFEEHWAGHGEFDDGERLAILVGGGAEAADGFAQRLVG